MRFDEDHKATERIEVLWRDVEPTLRAFVAAELRNPHDAEDVMQEVGKAVTQSIDRYDSDRPFANWAFGIARLQILQFYRRRSIERTTFSSELVEKIADAAVELTPTLSARREALAICVDSLGDRKRRALRLYYGERLKQSELGERLGMSASAVGVLLHRLRNTIRDCVQRRLGEN